jgi:hypothetical protein
VTRLARFLSPELVSILRLCINAANYKLIVNRRLILSVDLAIT